MHKYLFPILAAATLTFTAHAKDWTQWRGDLRDGVTSESVPLPWPAEGPKVLWKINVGFGNASFTVEGDRAYTMGNLADNQDAGVVFCLDAATGETIWKHEFPSPLEPNLFEGGQGATPTIDGDRVYVQGRQGQFFCLDKATGAVIWEKNWVDDFGAPKPRWGFAGSPLIAGNLVVVSAGAPGASAMALDKMTGEVIWKAGDDAASYSSPILFTHEGKELVAFQTEGYLRVRELADGREVMSFGGEWVKGANKAATPLIADGKIFVSGGYGAGGYLVPVGEGEVQEIWHSKEMKNHMSTCVLINGYLYGFDESELTCMDWNTGEVKWKEGSLAKGALIRIGNQLLIMSEMSRDENEPLAALVVAEPSPEGYKELARVPALPPRTWTIPVLANGKIFCRNNNGDAVCFDVSGQ